MTSEFNQKEPDLKILIVAGEASADLHAAHVLERMKERTNIEMIGIGGANLRALGMQPLADAEEMAVVGLTEAISRIPRSLQLIRELEQLAEKERPNVAMLLDLPDFNLRLAPRLKKLEIPVVYYVSPQVWAWRSGRAKQIAEYVDHLLCILPFEKPWFEQNAPKSLRVSYVGHPALEEIPETPYEARANRVLLMPGSRKKEIFNLLTPMLESAVKLHERIPELEFLLPLAKPLQADPEVKQFLARDGGFAPLLEKLGDSFRISLETSTDLLRSARVAVVASGTATLETALVGVPMVVVYKVSAMSAFIFRNFIGYTGPIAMANILHVGLGSDDRVVPELLQQDVNAERITGEVLKLLLSEEHWQKQANRLAETRSILRSGMASSPSENVMQALLEFQ